MGRYRKGIHVIPKRIISLTMDSDLVCLVDRERGLATRSAFVEDVLREKLVK